MAAARVWRGGSGALAVVALSAALCTAAGGAPDSWQLRTESVRPARGDSSASARALAALIDSGLLSEPAARPRTPRRPGIFVEAAPADDVELAASPDPPAAPLDELLRRLPGAIGFRRVQLQVYPEREALRVAALVELSSGAPAPPLKNLGLRSPAAGEGVWLAAAMSIDPERLLAWALEVARRLGPGEAQLLSDMLGIVRWNLLVDIERDFLRAFGGVLRASAWGREARLALGLSAELREPERLTSALARLAVGSLFLGPHGVGLRAASFGGAPGWRARTGPGMPEIGLAISRGEFMAALPAETIEAGPAELSAELAPASPLASHILAELGPTERCLVIGLDVSDTLGHLARAAREFGLDEGSAAAIAKLSALEGTVALAARTVPEGLAVWGSWVPRVSSCAGVRPVGRDRIAEPPARAYE